MMVSTRRKVERWLTRRGIAHLTDHSNVLRDVPIRAIPFLMAAFLVEGFGAAEAAWPWWADD